MCVFFHRRNVFTRLEIPTVLPDDENQTQSNVEMENVWVHTNWDKNVIQHMLENSMTCLINGDFEWCEHYLDGRKPEAFAQEDANERNFKFNILSICIEYICIMQRKKSAIDFPVDSAEDHKIFKIWHAFNSATDIPTVRNLHSYSTSLLLCRAVSLRGWTSCDWQFFPQSNMNIKRWRNDRFDEKAVWFLS